MILRMLWKSWHKYGNSYIGWPLSNKEKLTILEGNDDDKDEDEKYDDKEEDDKYNIPREEIEK